MGDCYDCISNRICIINKDFVKVYHKNEDNLYRVGDDYFITELKRLLGKHCRCFIKEEE